MKKTFITILLIISICKGYSQTRTFFASDKNYFWKPLSFSGEFRTLGHFRNREILTNYIEDTQNSSRFSLGGLIHSESYFWHPNFLLLNIEAEYNPDFIKERFIVIPDQNETRTLKRLNIKTSLFNNKIISLNSHINLSQTYSNRDNLTNINTNTKQWGSMLSFPNKITPLNLSFNKTNWTQTEIETGRISSMNQSVLTGRISKSFYSNDKHSLVFSHNEYSYNYINLYQTQISSNYITLNDNFNFDAEKKYNFRSRISYQNQKGTVNYIKFQATENLLLKLPKRLTFSTTCNYNNLEYEEQNSETNNIKTNLQHKLFLSLNTNIFYEYRKTIHSVYAETYHILGSNIYYTKKIPLKGRINLSYNYRRQYFRTVSEPVNIQVINENHTLSDRDIVMLDRPYINRTSIIITDITGSIIYQENLDYIIIERNNYIEIQRFPGGQIQNNQDVLISYIVSLPETYSYNLNFNKFSSNISFWNRALEVYFNISEQNYFNILNADILILNYFTQYQYGIRTNIKFVTAGIEFDNYNSSIIPYEMVRYYLSTQKSFNEKLILSVNGNIRNYYLTNENVNHLYTDISIRSVYKILHFTSVNLELGYRKQIGTGINLDLLVGKLEITTQYHQLFATLGVEKYNRNFLGEINNYNGIFFRLIRKF